MWIVGNAGFAWWLQGYPGMRMHRPKFWSDCLPILLSRLCLYIMPYREECSPITDPHPPRRNQCTKAGPSSLRKHMEDVGTRVHFMIFDSSYSRCPLGTQIEYSHTFDARGRWKGNYWKAWPGTTCMRKLHASNRRKGRWVAFYVADINCGNDLVCEAFIIFDHHRFGVVCPFRKTCALAPAKSNRLCR